MLIDTGIGHTISRERALFAELGLGEQTAESGGFDKQTGRGTALWAEAWRSR